MLESSNHVHIWLVSLQLSCSDTYQIWSWCSIGNQSFGTSEKLKKVEHEHSSSNPHHRTGCTNHVWFKNPKAPCTRKCIKNFMDSRMHQSYLFVSLSKMLLMSPCFYKFLSPTNINWRGWVISGWTSLSFRPSCWSFGCIFMWITDQINFKLGRCIHHGPLLNWLSFLVDLHHWCLVMQGVRIHYWNQNLPLTSFIVCYVWCWLVLKWLVSWITESPWLFVMQVIHITGNEWTTVETSKSFVILCKNVEDYPH